MRTYLMTVLQLSCCRLASWVMCRLREIAESVSSLHIYRLMPSYILLPSCASCLIPWNHNKSTSSQSLLHDVMVREKRVIIFYLLWGILMFQNSTVFVNGYSKFHFILMSVYCIKIKRWFIILIALRIQLVPGMATPIIGDSLVLEKSANHSFLCCILFIGHCC